MSWVDTARDSALSQGKPSTCRGIIRRAPASVSSSLHVEILSWGAETTYEVTAGHWVPRSSTLPVVGAQCLVMFDHAGDAWVPAYESSATAGPVLGGDAAGGDLTGTYPNPTIDTGKVTSAKILDGTIVDGDVASANKDGTAGTPSMRTLGTGAQQGTAGNDSRLSDARTPTAHHTTHEPGGSDAMAVDAVAATGSLRTLGTGAQQAAPGRTRPFRYYVNSLTGLVGITANTWQIVYAASGTPWVADFDPDTLVGGVVPEYNAPRTGYYRVTVMWTISAGSSPVLGAGWAAWNGSAWVQQRGQQSTYATAVNVTTAFCSGIASLASGTLVLPMIYSSTTALNLPSPASLSNSFEVHQVA